MNNPSFIIKCSDNLTYIRNVFLIIKLRLLIKICGYELMDTYFALYRHCFRHFQAFPHNWTILMLRFLSTEQTKNVHILLCSVMSNVWIAVYYLCVLVPIYILLREYNKKTAGNNMSDERQLMLHNLCHTQSFLVVYGIRNFYVNCFHDLNLFVIFFSLLAVRSPERNDHKQLLIYWVVYSLFICIERLGYRLFDLLLIFIDLLENCLSCSLLFYWLAKCIFLVWFMKSGSRMISRHFTQHIDILNDVQGGKYKLQPNLFIEQKRIHSLVKYWSFEFM
jgi:hypothetical protein